MQIFEEHARKLEYYFLELIQLQCSLLMYLPGYKFSSSKVDRILGLELNDCLHVPIQMFLATQLEAIILVRHLPIFLYISFNEDANSWNIFFKGKQENFTTKVMTQCFKHHQICVITPSQDFHGPVNGKVHPCLP